MRGYWTLSVHEQYINGMLCLKITCVSAYYRRSREGIKSYAILKILLKNIVSQFSSRRKTSKAGYEKSGNTRPPAKFSQILYSSEQITAGQLSAVSSLTTFDIKTYSILCKFILVSFVTLNHSLFGPCTMRSNTTVNSCIHLLGFAWNMHELSIKVNASGVQKILLRQCISILARESRCLFSFCVQNYTWKV